MNANDGETMLHRSRTIAASALAVFVAFTISACGPVVEPAADPAPASTQTSAPAAPSSESSTPSATTSDTPAAAASAVGGAALDALAALPIKGRAPKTGYEREQFGQAWADVDKNGCDTRNDVLLRDLVDETFKPGTRDCVVLTGTLNDPYSGTVINFQRGQDTSSDVQIDHIIALSNAWQTGAQQLDEATRIAFANDPLNLLAADGPLNMQKSDGDAATWLPPNKGFRCAYVARQVAVKSTYGLWVTQAEHDAMASVLNACPTEPLPTGGNTPQALTAATVPTTTAPAPAPAPADGTVTYANCAAVRAAGAASIRTGDPGYSTKFDGDGDGIACE